MEVQKHNEKIIFQKYLSVLLCENLPSNEAEYEQKDVNLEEIAYIINNLESFICTFPSALPRSEVISKLAELITGFGLVPKFGTDDRDFGREDFPNIAEYAQQCFESFKVMVKEVKALEQGPRRRFLISSVLLCATHDNSYYWTSDASIKMCKEFSEDLLLCTQHQNFSSLLIDDSFHPTIFKGVLKKMRPSLLKDTWMLYPSACHVFSWLLHHVKHPYLVDYLSDVLPPAFMFASYFKPSHQAMGIQCFDHILDNVPQSLIKLDGMEDAIYHSLFPCTYSKEPCVVSVLFPCLLKLPMMKAQKTRPVLWGEFDKVFNNLLFTMAMENNMTLKRMFLAHILAFSEHTPPLKHLKRLMVLVKETLNDSVSPDADCQITALKILKSIIKTCWPRMPNYCFEILVLILQLQENESNSANKDEIYRLREECIVLLKCACCDTFESLTSSYIEDCPDLPEAKFLRNVLTKCS